MGQEPHPRSERFRSPGFGTFIHWGPYSALGHGEWTLHDERIPLDEYDRITQRFTAYEDEGGLPR